jgi:photosystem II stability/assembly factor-like uncharacterized protein
MNRSSFNLKYILFTFGFIIIFGNINRLARGEILPVNRQEKTKPENILPFTQIASLTSPYLSNVSDNLGGNEYSSEPSLLFPSNIPSFQTVIRRREVNYENDLWKHPTSNRSNVESNIGNWVIVNSPTENWMNSVDMVSVDDGWAVGGNGTILHWNGDLWSISTSPTTNTLFSIDMISATDGWIVGSGGIILHWDGDVWSSISSPTTVDLSSVDMLSTIDGWAVGAGKSTQDSVILHWTGDNWNIVTDPTTTPLVSIDMISASDGWAVGSMLYGSQGSVILRWNGDNWSEVNNPSDYALDSIHMLSSSDGWIVGGYIATYSTILRWNGYVLNY